MEENPREEPSVKNLLLNDLEMSPLDMNCEDAVSFMADHIYNLGGFESPDLTALSNSAFLDKISEMMLSSALTECIGISLYPILPCLVGRWANLGDGSTESIACALGRLIHIEPKLKRYSLHHTSLISDIHRSCYLKGLRFYGLLHILLLRPHHKCCKASFRYDSAN